MVKIRFQTPLGATQVWEVEDKTVKNTDAACAAYLAYWHPNYLYIGRDGYPDVVKAADLPLQPTPDAAADSAATDLIDTVLAVSALMDGSMTEGAEPDDIIAPAPPPDTPPDTPDFSGGGSGGGGSDSSF